MQVPLLIYYSLKGLLLVTLARSFAVNEAFQRHWIFFSGLYTAGIAALSWVFVLSINPAIASEVWKHWLLKTFLVAAIFFKLLAKFDEGCLFWAVFSAGLLGLIWF